MTFPCKVVINSHTKYFVWVNVLKNDFMYFNIKSGLPICETLFFVETNMTFDLLHIRWTYYNLQIAKNDDLVRHPVLRISSTLFYH